jgi:outer membrane immunogenic protein
MLKVALKYGLAAAASLSFAGAAAADGYEAAGSLKDTAPAPIAYEWNGLSVGAGIGVGRFDQDAHGKAWRKDRFDKYKKKCYQYGPCKWQHKYGFGTFNKLESSASDDDWNVFGTVQVGYDRLLGDRFLIGAFADFDFFKDSDLTFSSKKGFGSLNGKVEKDNLWTAGGRLGFLVTPRVLVYGLLGYSRMSLEGSLDAHFNGPGKDTNLPLKIDDNVDGWTVGAGVETKLDQRLSLKLEYRYSEFDGAAAKVTDADYDVWKYNKWKLVHSTKQGAKLDLDDTEVHSVRAVLSFKLGGHETAYQPLK